MKLQQILITLFVSLIVSLTALAVSAGVSELLPGRNTSDVGVPMFSSPILAYIAGMLVFAAFVWGIRYLILRYLNKNMHKTTYLTVNILVLALYLLLNAFALNL